MNKIGIMQGRVSPERLDKLQIFPVSNWENEIHEIDLLGFDCVELLFDKNLILKRLLNNSDTGVPFGIKDNAKPNEFCAQSFCVDYLSTLSMLSRKTEQHCYDIIHNLLQTVANTSICVLVIPLLEAGSVASERDLRMVLDWICKRKLDETAFECDITLALEMDLPSHQIKSAFTEHSFSNIAVCYDLGNARAAGKCPEEEIITLNDLIAHIHIKDRKINGPNVMLGQGDVDFDACFCAMDRIGYEGQMILETIYEVSPEAEAARNLQFVQARVAEILS